VVVGHQQVIYEPLELKLEGEQKQVVEVTILLLEVSEMVEMDKVIVDEGDEEDEVGLGEDEDLLEEDEGELLGFIQKIAMLHG
jgi:hypothetical protein